MWVTPSVCHSTTSVSSTGRFAAVQRGRPSPDRLWFGRSPLGTHLVGRVRRDPHVAGREAGPLGDQRRILGEQRGRRPARQELVADGVAPGVGLAAVEDRPVARRLRVGVVVAGQLVVDHGALDADRVAVRVVGPTGTPYASFWYDGVLPAVDLGVEAEGEQVLVVRRDEVLGDAGAVRRRSRPPRPSGSGRCPAA